MKKNGFTLVELAVVTIILGILAVSAIPVSTSILRSARIQDTKEKLDAIETALEAYLIINGSLPCPASLKDETSDATFGQEKVSGDTCQSSAGNGYFNVGNLFYGAVPVNTLGLSDSAMSDGWGNKIGYVMDGRFSSAFTTTTEDSNGMTVNTKSDSTTKTITTDAIYLLVSHGENKYGAFPLDSSTQLSVSGISTEEALNYYDDSTPYTTTFMNYYYAEDFDDYVRYKTKMQMIMDIDWQDIGCVALTSPRTYSAGAYGEIVEDSTEVYCRKCYKYSRWGEEYTCPTS